MIVVFTHDDPDALQPLISNTQTSYGSRRSAVARTSVEDVDPVRRLRARRRLYRAPAAALTSARKWERDGWITRTAIHLRLLLSYFLKFPPEILAASSEGGGRDGATA